MYPQSRNNASFVETGETRSSQEFSIQKFVSANTSGMSDEEFKMP